MELRVDAELLRMACEQPELRGQLLEQYRAYLLMLARLQIGRRLRGKVDPADAVQDAFLHAHRAFASFAGDNETAFVAWLRGVLAGQIAHLVRRYFSKTRNVNLEEVIERELNTSSHMLSKSLVGSSSSPSERAAYREQAVRLADALERLPADYRDVILLRQIEELPFAEIAERLGRSVDSVQKRWVRGLDRLRTILEAES